jgi:hypothetical protein
MRRTTEIFQYVVGSAVFMGLGWQLPGNVAGVFLALWLCIVLRIEMRRAAPILAIAALGLMEARLLLSGQRPPGFMFPWLPMAWLASGGLLGFTFGAFLGLGLVSERLELSKFYTLVICFTAVCLGTLYGAHSVRSNAIFGESASDSAVIRFTLYPDLWAGLLLGTLVMLLGLWAFGRQRMPMRFALYGAAGGAAGCTLWILLQWITRQTGPPVFESTLRILGPWILGASLGGACGWCALRHRDELSEITETTAPEPWCDLDYKVLGLSTGFVIFLVYLLGGLSAPLADAAVPLQAGGFFESEQAFAFVVCSIFSCLMLWSARSSTVAWQLAVTMPVFASVSGLLARLSMGVNSTSATFVIGLPLLTLLFVAGGVCLWQSRANQPLACMALGLLWICSACALLIAPADNLLFKSGTGATVLRAMLLCAGTIYCTLALWHWRQLSGAPRAPRPA